MPNGSDVAVTRENRLPYIHLVSHYRLTKQIKLQSEAFFEGLSEMIEPNWLRYVCNPIGNDRLIDIYGFFIGCSTNKKSRS